MSPKQIVEKWIDAFNHADVDKLASLYHEDATNHQVANEPVKGKAAIRSMFEDEFLKAEMTCIPVNIFSDGDWAILEWVDPLDMRGCGFFKVVDDKIVIQRGYWDKLSFLKLHNLPISVD